MASLESLPEPRKLETLEEKDFGGENLEEKTLGGEKLLERKTSQHLEELEVCILRSLSVQGKPFIYFSGSWKLILGVDQINLFRFGIFI